jgi:hypothetical protein
MTITLMVNIGYSESNTNKGKTSKNSGSSGLIWKNLSFGMDIDTVKNNLEQIGLNFEGEKREEQVSIYDVGELQLTCLSVVTYQTVRISNTSYTQEPSLGFYNDRLSFIAYEINDKINYDDKNYINNTDAIKLLKTKYGGKVSYLISSYGRYPVLTAINDKYLLYSQGLYVRFIDPRLLAFDRECRKNRLNRGKDRI